MNIGDKVNRSSLIRKINLNDFRSEILLKFGPRIGGLSHGRFVREYKNNDEIWTFLDKSNKIVTEGFVLIRNDIIVDMEY